MTVQERNSAVVRLAGDSGDGIQLAGAQLTRTSALCGNAVWTAPDFPAEIRAPAGSLAGVSGFQVQFGGDVHTPGDRVDAARRHEPGGAQDALERPGCGWNPDRQPRRVRGRTSWPRPATRPIRSRTARWPVRRLMAVPITALNREAVADRHVGAPPLLSQREVDRCKNFFALGLVYWLFERPLGPTLRWIKEKFARNPAVLEANRRALQAGCHYGETTEALPAPVRVGRRAAAAGPLPQRNRQRGAGAGPGRRGADGRAAAAVRRLPDRAGLRRAAPAGRTEAVRRADLPGRGRDRGDGGGGRRGVRRRPGRDGDERPRPVARSRRRSAWR